MKQRNICKFIAPLPLETLNVSCFVLETNPDTMKKKARMGEHCAILVAQGKGTFSLDKTVFSVSAGQLIFAFKDEWFSVSNQENCEYMYIRFSGTRAEELFRRFGIQKDCRSFDGFSGMIPLWRESLSRACADTIALAAESILLHSFSRLSQSAAQKDKLLLRILEITEERFCDPELSLGVIARELSYNAKYLSHYFKEKKGIGYSEYLKTIRINYAVTLFDHGISSVKNIALLSGFTDPLYFSSVFKKCIGLSPTEYKSAQGMQAD